MGQLSVVGSILFYIGTFGLSGLMSKVNTQKRLVKLLLVIIPPVFWQLLDITLVMIMVVIFGLITMYLI